MTQINLPNLSITGANLWSQVEDNDKAIRDVVNGNLDATNLADDAVTAAKLRDDASTDANRAVTTNHIRDAAVTADKLATDAVTTAKIDTGAVTAAEIAAQAIVSGKLKIATYINTGSATFSAPGQGQDIVIAEQSSVAPGIYLAFGQITNATVAGTGIGFATNGGTATVTEVTRQQTGVGDLRAANALIQVTSTTTVRFVFGQFGPSGSVSASISLYGIAAS